MRRERARLQSADRRGPEDRRSASRLPSRSRLSRARPAGEIFFFTCAFYVLSFLPACARERQCSVESAHAGHSAYTANVATTGGGTTSTTFSRDKAVADKTPYSTGPQEVPEEQPVAVPPTPPDRANRCDVVPIKQPGHIAQPHVAHDQDHENEPRTRLVSRQDRNGEKAQRVRSGGVKGARECSRITNGLS